MLDYCLKILIDELNTYINTKTGLSEEPVIYADPQAYDRSREGKPNDKILMSLVDLFQESLNSGAKSYIPQGNRYITQNQPVTFSIYLLLSTYFQPQKALEGLKYLTQVIAFFQHKNYFNQQNTPALQQIDIDQLSVSLTNLNYQEKHALWSVLGMPYQPSVVYKVGMIAIADAIVPFPDVAAVQDITIRTN